MLAQQVKVGPTQQGTVHPLSPAAIAARRNAYIAQLNAPAELTSATKTPEFVGWCHVDRITNSIRKMKYECVIGRADTSTITLSATRRDSKTDQTSSIYAIIYCDGNTPRYVCTGPTFRSQDGEYRNRLIPFDRFMSMYEKHSDVFDDIDAVISPRIEAGWLTFQANFYSVGAPRELAEIVSGRLPMRLFLACWMYDAHNIHFGMVENHINPAYQYIMAMDELDDDFAHIFESNPTRFRDAHFDMIFFSDAKTAVLPLHVGQKTFPLGVSSVVEDIRHDVWREIFATGLASNLVLNSISPSFSFINNWFYVHHAHGALFDNFAMHERYTHGQLATDMAGRLRSIDAQTRTDTTYLSSEFEQLSERIMDATKYAESDIALTDLAAVVTSEYVGRTLRDIPSLLESGVHSPELGCIFRQANIFRGHVLEFMYAIYCMNTKAMMIHGDLHMNNVTIMQLFHMFDVEKWAHVPNAKKAYVVRGGATTHIYHADHVGTFSMIIDFSRAIIGDRARIERAMGARGAAHTNDDFFDSQTSRLVELVMHFVPKLASMEGQIRALAQRDFALAFKVCTAIDALVLCTNWATLFAIDPSIKSIKVAPGNVELLDEIARHAEKLLLELMKKALGGAIADSFDWPLATIIEHSFANDKFGVTSTLPATAYHDPSKPPVYVDIFNSANDLVYDIADYDAWGPILSPDIEDAKSGQYAWNERPGIVTWREHKNADDTAVSALVAPWVRGGSDDAAAWMFE